MSLLKFEKILVPIVAEAKVSPLSTLIRLQQGLLSEEGSGKESMRVRTLWFGTATLVVVSVLFATVQVSVCAKVRMCCLFVFV